MDETAPCAPRSSQEAPWLALAGPVSALSPARAALTETQFPRGPSPAARPAQAFSTFFMCGTWELTQHFHAFRGRRRIFHISSVCRVDGTSSWLILSLRSTKSL